MIKWTKKNQQMPTTIVLEIFSWVIVFLGISGAIYMTIFDFQKGRLPMLGFFILFNSLLAAALVRMFANIGQMLFDSKQMLEQMNCDCKDMNLNIEQITGIFEQVEQHLDFKK